MKYFDTLQQLIDYIPNCLICKKPLYITLNGRWSLSEEEKWNDSFHTNEISVFVKEGFLYPKNKKLNFKIDISNNMIIDNLSFFKKIHTLSFSAHKKCRTCAFCISFTTRNENHIAKVTRFPRLLLQYENIKYYTKNSKYVHIFKEYDTFGKYADNAIILINKKKQYFPADYLKLDKIKDFSSLKNKLSTILTFQ
jgi:hypothetical protein